MQPDSELAIRYAPLLYLEPYDPPGDPLAFLSRSRLVWWSNENGSTPAVTEPTPLATVRWRHEEVGEAIEGGELTRPFTSSPDRRAPLDEGFCLEPAVSPSKYLTAARHAAPAADEFGRRKPRTQPIPEPPDHPTVEPDRKLGLFLPRPDLFERTPAGDEAEAIAGPDGAAYDVDAPCFFDVERLPEGRRRITYWLFYPTSTLPRGEMEALVAFLAASGAALPGTRDEKPFERVSPAPAPDDSPTRMATLAQANSVDELFATQLKPGEKMAWSSPWSALYGETSHEIARSKNPVAQLAAGAFAGLAMHYEIQERLLRDIKDRFLHAPAMALVELASYRIREIAASHYVHQGDWEAVSVEVDRAGELDRLAFWGHGAPVVRRAHEVTIRKEAGGDHVEALVAVGSHASYPDLESADRHKEAVPDPSRRSEWRTWQNLSPAPEQTAWYGFGGAWGRPRLPPIGRLRWREFRGLDLWKESTGPLGPGPAKLSQQAAALGG